MVVLGSAARTASEVSAIFINRRYTGAHFSINVGAIVATPSIVVTIQGYDETSATYYTILASAAITTVSTTILRVHPGLTAAANSIANDGMPRKWRVSVVNADADEITFSIDVNYIP